MYKRPVGTIYLLKRAELAVRSCMDFALAEFDLTPAQFLMLYRLRDHTELSGAAPARDIGVRPGAADAPDERGREAIGGCDTCRGPH